MKKFIIIAAIALVPVFTFSQSFISTSWDMATGIGDTYMHITKPSVRGMTFIDARSFQTENFSIGGSFGWNTFYESEEGSFTEGSSTTTGKQFKYINSFPLMMNFHYYIDEDPEDLSFYVGGGIGTHIIEQRTDLGLYSTGVGYVWHFGLQPQIGILIPVGEVMDFHFAFKYNHAFEAGNRSKVQYFTLSFGIARW